jgi:predicted  nucleic acid-binding Zn-ribbon protein
MAVTATPEQQRALLDVQALDTSLLQVAHKRGSIPETAMVRELEVELGSIDMRIVAAATEMSDRTLDLRKAESDVEQVVNRAKRDRERMDSGAVSAKDMENLQHEIESLARRQSELEDVELEVMQSLEEATAAHDALVASRAEVELKLTETRARLTEATDALDATQAGIDQERVIAVAAVPADLLALYDKVRADQGGVGAALLQRGTCQGCHIALDAGELDRIRATAPDAIVRCEECRRILVRTAESGL